MAVINELITELGFNLKDGTTRKIDEFESKINGLSESFAKIGKTVTGGLGIKDFFMGALGNANDIVNMSKAYKISTDALQEWKYAAEASGVSAENLMTDLYHLRKDFFMNEKAVLDLADRFKSMDEAQALWEGQSLYGLSIDTILALKRGSKELREEFSKAPKTPKEVLENAKKLNNELNRQKANFKKIAETIALEYTPKINVWLEKFNKWMGESPAHSEMLVQGISGALALLTGSEVVGGISKFAGEIGPLVKALGGLKGILAGGAIAFAVRQLYDSFNAWKNGEETIIPWDAIVEDFKIASDRIGELIDGIKDKWNSFKNWLKSEEGQETKKTVSGYVGAALGGVKEATEIIGNFYKDTIHWGGAFIGGALNSPGGLFRPFDMVKNAFEAGNLSLQDAQTIKDLGWDKYFNPDFKTTVPPNQFGVDNQNFAGLSVTREVGLDSKTIRNLSETITEGIRTNQWNGNTPMGQGGAPNFAGSMITVFTADTMADAVRYMVENGALMSDVEDMSAYQTNTVE